jgi:hypothetical protein
VSKLVYILGYNGNMASRYKAILNFLGVPHVGHDKNEPFHFQAHAATHFIVCTPTDRHLADISSCLSFQKPVLCEKPLTTHLASLLEVNDAWKCNRHLISMVNQYEEIAGSAQDEPSFYNYFKTGTDGLYWDCINILGLAKDGCTVNNSSPEWTCMINGKTLSINMMDQAYIDMIQRWLDNPVSNWEYALHAHAKVAKILEHTCQKS